jgi:hypothetical protein
MKGKFSRLVVAVLVGVLAFSSFGFAYAEQGRPPVERGGRRGAMIKGEVIAIDGDVLTVETEQRGEITVQTDARTRYRAPNDDNASLADIQVGDTIAARGRFTDQGTLRARMVLIVPPELADDVRGKVTAIDGDTITIEDRDGDAVEIVTSADTKFHLRGKPDASLDDVEVGMLLGAAGEFDANGALIARQVVAGEPRQPLKGGPIAGGKVAEVNAGEIVLSYPDGSTLTVTTDASTLFITRGEGGPTLGSLSDVSAGARIVAMGVPSDDGGSLAARVIMLVPERQPRGPQPDGPPQM